MITIDDKGIHTHKQVKAETRFMFNITYEPITHFRQAKLFSLRMFIITYEQQQQQQRQQDEVTETVQSFFSNGNKQSLWLEQQKKTPGPDYAMTQQRLRNARPFLAQSLNATQSLNTNAS